MKKPTCNQCGLSLFKTNYSQYTCKCFSDNGYFIPRYLMQRIRACVDMALEEAEQHSTHVAPHIQNTLDKIDEIMGIKNEKV